MIKCVTAAVEWAVVKDVGPFSKSGVHVKGVGADLDFNSLFTHLLHDAVTILNKYAEGLIGMLACGICLRELYVPDVSEKFPVSVCKFDPLVQEFFYIPHLDKSDGGKDVAEFVIGSDTLE